MKILCMKKMKKMGKRVTVCHIQWTTNDKGAMSKRDTANDVNRMAAAATALLHQQKELRDYQIDGLYQTP